MGKYRVVDHRILERNGKSLLFLPDSLVVCELDEYSSSILNGTETIELEALDKIAEDAGLDVEGVKEAFEEFKSLRILQDEATEVGERSLPDSYTTTISGLWLIIAQDCNLRCKYCSAGYGRFGYSEPNLMKRDVAEKALNMMFDSVDSDYKGTLSVTFMGGEPLLNFDLLKWVVLHSEERATALGRKIGFNMNSNATLFDKDKLKFFDDHRIPVTVSIDGPRSVHDSCRVYASGTGSYDDVRAGLELALKERKNYTTRTQTVLDDPAMAVDSIKHLYDIGVRRFIMNPAFNSKFLDTDYNHDAGTLHEFAAQFKQLNDFLMKELANGEYTGFNFMLRFMESLHRRSPNFSVCGAGKLLAVACDGTLYPCQGLVGFPGQVLGNVFDGVDSVKRREFYRSMVAFGHKCIGCFARYICGGACVALAMVENQMDNEEPSDRCDIYRMYIEEAIWSYYAMMQLEPRRRPRFLAPLEGVQQH